MSTNGNDQKATLGCGTLILIALIVLFFSNSGKDDLKDGQEQLKIEIQKLQETVEAQSGEIQQLREALEKQSPQTSEQIETPER